MTLQFFDLSDKEESLKNDPLRDFHVWWMDPIPRDVVKGLRDCIDTARDEKPIQQFLAQHPILFIVLLHGGHGRWVIPLPRFGAEFVPDFVIGEGDSGGKHWTLVELESPLATLFTQKGPPAKELNQAMYQIRTWRSWIAANTDYAMRPPAEKGLGLAGISTNAKALILIGRRPLTPTDVERRRELEMEQRATIHTYDWLVDIAAANSEK